MTFAAIRAFFRTHMNALNYREWRDAFNVANIPSTIINGSYHIDTTTGQRRDAYNQLDQAFEQDVIIRVFFKGYRNSADAVDASMTALDTITARILDSEYRAGSTIKNIYLNQIQIQPLDQTNDNAAILEISFSCLIIICT